MNYSAAKEARPFLTFLGVLTLIAFFYLWWLALIPMLLFGYVMYFFRDPEREIPTDPQDIVSAADGKVIAVDELVEDYFTKAKMKRVAVFLSVFDVHVNRSPVEGKVLKIHHHAGEFLDARDPEVDVKNEAQHWLLETSRGAVVVRQIAGLIARRIVAWSQEGDSLAKGERFGMIRFGSRTDLYLPLDCEILVEVGQRVQGGTSVVARWKDRGV
ncbi:MAG: phosphatidylserine decarboxylase family protein [Blastochloris sp.]|nr:phosphatidylserine decarboxylase family protein [Blastochloris sp.]